MGALVKCLSCLLRSRLHVKPQGLVTIFIYPLTTQLEALRKLHTEPPICASHPSFGHLVKQLQRRRYLEVKQSETRIACGGHVY